MRNGMPESFARSAVVTATIAPASVGMSTRTASAASAGVEYGEPGQFIARPARLREATYRGSRFASLPRDRRDSLASGMWCRSR